MIEMAPIAPSTSSPIPGPKWKACLSSGIFFLYLHRFNKDACLMVSSVQWLSCRVHLSPLQKDNGWILEHHPSGIWSGLRPFINFPFFPHFSLNQRRTSYSHWLLPARLWHQIQGRQLSSVVFFLLKILLTRKNHYFIIGSSTWLKAGFVSASYHYDWYCCLSLTVIY